VFDGEVVVAYEGPKRRVHLCIVDDLDPYGLAGDRKNRRMNISNDSLPAPGADSGMPGTPDRLPPSPSPVDRSLPIGQRLLPSILIETEIGQADKHVLRNVSRVERCAFKLEQLNRSFIIAGQIPSRCVAKDFGGRIGISQLSHYNLGLILSEQHTVCWWAVSRVGYTFLIELRN
jgi:hypothetical protein